MKQAETYYNENLSSLKMLSDMINNCATRADLSAVMAEVDTIKEVLANLKSTGTDVDLSNYVTKEEINAVIQYVQNQMTEKYETLLKNEAALQTEVTYLRNEVLKNTEEIAMLREMIEQLRKEVTELSGE